MKKLLLAALVCASPSAYADVPFAVDVDRPFHEYTWLTAHNAFVNSPGLFPNQTLAIRRQLQSGVRGLMLDLHESAGRVRLCHGTCVGLEPTFADVLNDEILPYVRSVSHTVVTLHLEDPVSREALAAELAHAPDAVALTFNPASWDTATWPTLRQMADAGQRLVILSQHYRNAGAIETAAGLAHVLFDRAYTSENEWSLGASIAEHDTSCRSRWEGQSLGASITSGDQAWPRLFVMNHFHGVPLGGHSWFDNRYDTLRARIDDACAPEAGRKPNYVAVDFVEAGQVGSVVAALNLGTIEFFDGVDGAGERLCAVAAGGRRTVDLDENDLDRCPPRRVRSAVIRDVPAGTRITLSDGISRRAPRMTVDVRHDLAGERALVARFDTPQADDHVMAEIRDGGPSRGITHVAFEPPPR
ncbi:hypothetical protein ABIE56_004326 [Luteibacter sp. 621]|uniref:hypothetical protein n=1 Tax=Luteibacter sp. 621 TaxID=3373916 RepID=UPI003D1DF10E